jgi:chemotaxis protein histidine kinase CheA
MQERARIIGGKVSITGSPGKGTRISLDTPLTNKDSSQEEVQQS